ncbi:MAG: RiPP maturation radical SAM C-methyltransferase [Desulfobulbaceae bacterium]
MRLALVSMPWAIFNRPSIQLGALQAWLRVHDPAVQTVSLHPYLEVAKRLGPETYAIISEDGWAGEALYAPLLFPEMRESAARVFRDSLGREKARGLPPFAALVEELDDQLDRWLDRTDFSRTDLAGFSVCFGQLPATLLAARRLKARHPGLRVVLGGSTCVPPIGETLLNVFPEIDYIVTGEGELPLAGLCRYLRGETTDPGPGVLHRGRSSRSAGPEIPDLDTLPPPDYDDYFAELGRCGFTFIPQVPLEFSRGCWWNRCAFCNLNLQWCGYRSKKSRTVLAEVEQMRSSYRVLDFAFTDNALPPGEADRFFTSVAGQGRDLRFFAEIRTINRPDHYCVYRRGGLTSVQVGIESFSSSLLRKMDKGTNVLDNLAAMKFSAEAGIRLDGNLILEFPGSTEEEARETMRVIDFALPYRPLFGAAFFLGHGSPVWRDPSRFGIRGVRHHPRNRALYPRSVLKRLDLLIRQGVGDRQVQRRIWAPVRNKIEWWRAFHEKRSATGPPLGFRDGGDFLIIRQERPEKPTLHHRLAGLSRAIYLACSTPVTIQSLLRTFDSVTEERLIRFLDDLEEKKLLFREGGRCLALAVHNRNNLEEPGTQP